jgi:hypothetical protein
MRRARAFHVATPLQSGQILVTGGGVNETNSITNTVELYVP